MENFKKWLQHRREQEENQTMNRIPAIIGLLLTAIFTGIFIYVASTYFSNLNNPEVSAPVIVSERPPNRFLSPNVYVCTTETRPRLIWSRAKRDVPNLLKRVARPLSPAPPIFSANGLYDPPLYHDAGAKCAWGRIAGRRVPDIENVGVSYDSQQLGARACDDHEVCKSICLRMHKSDDPYLCNYFTWNREKKVALFYFLEPTIRWNLTQDTRVETYFWQCKATDCAWFWRPRRIQPFLADLTAKQMKSGHGLISVSQCTDFASCQFACETRPSYRELQEQGQIIPSDVINLDEPSCDYVVMPSTDQRSQFSFLFSMHQHVLKNSTYASSSTYDSFELICKDSGRPASPNSAAASAGSAPSSATKVTQGQASAVVIAAPPPQPGNAATQAVAPQLAPPGTNAPSPAAAPGQSQPQPPAFVLPPAGPATDFAASSSTQEIPAQVVAPVGVQVVQTSSAANQSVNPVVIPSQAPIVPVGNQAGQVVVPVTLQATSPGQASTAPSAAAPAAQAVPQLAQSATTNVATPIQPITAPVVPFQAKSPGQTSIAPSAAAPASQAVPQLVQSATTNVAPPIQPITAPVVPIQAADPSSSNVAAQVPHAQSSFVSVISLSAQPQAQPLPQVRKREVPQQQTSDTVHLRECKQGGKVVDCSKLTKDAKLESPCIQLTADPTSEHLSIVIDSKKPVWFSVEQPSLDGLEEHVSLTPGRQHVIDMRIGNSLADSGKCGPLSIRGRRCAATCNDRLAIDVCGCSLNNDPDTGLMGSLMSVPLCTDQQLKSCVLDQLRSDSFFDCMNDCKKECSTWHPFEFQSDKGTKLDSDDYLVLDLHFQRAINDARAEPMWWNKSVEQMLQVWAPAMMVLMLLLAVVAVIYVTTRR